MWGGDCLAEWVEKGWGVPPWVGKAGEIRVGDGTLCPRLEFLVCPSWKKVTEFLLLCPEAKTGTMEIPGRPVIRARAGSDLGNSWVGCPIEGLGLWKDGWLVIAI